MNPSESLLISGLQVVSITTACTLLAGLLAFAASGLAQTNRRTSTRLSLSVYVIPVVSSVRAAGSFLSGPIPDEVNSAISLPTFRWEPVETVRPLLESPWASRAPCALPTLAQAKDSGGAPAPDNLSILLSKPPSTVPPNGEIVLRTVTYVPK